MIKLGLVDTLQGPVPGLHIPGWLRHGGWHASGRVVLRIHVICWVGCARTKRPSAKSAGWGGCSPSGVVWALVGFLQEVASKFAEFAGSSDFLLVLFSFLFFYCVFWSFSSLVSSVAVTIEGVACSVTLLPLNEISIYQAWSRKKIFFLILLNTKIPSSLVCFQKKYIVKVFFHDGYSKKSLVVNLCNSFLYIWGICVKG